MSKYADMIMVELLKIADSNSDLCSEERDDCRRAIAWMQEMQDAGATIARLTAEVERLRARCGRLRDLAADASSGMVYIEGAHGRLYGVGWDRVRDKRIMCEQHNDLKEPTDG